MFDGDHPIVDILMLIAIIVFIICFFILFYYVSEVWFFGVG